MDENEKEQILKHMDDRIKFVECVFKCTPESIEDAKKLLPKFSKDFVIKLILFVSKKKIFGYELLGQLFAAADIKTISFSFDQHMNFMSYLYKAGIVNDEMLANQFSFISEDFQEMDQYLHPVQPHTIWSFIQKDDVNSFVDYVTVNNINLQKEGFFANQIPYFVIEFTCYCGAINILKYLFLNNIPMTSITVDCAIEGGSEEVIEFLVEHDVSFNSMMGIAVYLHQNKIVKWLYNNYKDSYFKLPSCLMYYNYEIFLYFVDECGYDINSMDNWKRNSLDIAELQNDPELIKFLLLKGAKHVEKKKKTTVKKAQEK